MIMRIPEDFLDQGGFWVPHFILDAESGLSKHERLLLVVLIAIEDEFLGNHSRGTKIFFATNKLVCQRSGISPNAIPAIRQHLRLKGLIRYIPGRTRQATEYQILFDRFYRVYKETLDYPKTYTPQQTSYK